MFMIRVLTITLLHGVWFAAICAVGGEVVACPAGCRCSPLDGYIDSIYVKCNYLDLSETPLSRPVSVHTLDLSHNVIRNLRNNSFSSYLGLISVILSYNELEDIQSNAFAGLQMIRNIDLSHNNLKSIHPEIFSSNPKLEFLSLNSNPLTNPSSQSPILVSDSVIRLDLSSCSLTEIHPLMFSRLPRLRSVDLSSNHLQALSVRTLENLPDLKTLQLDNNRWACSCDVIELMQWTNKSRGHLPAHRPIKCLQGGKYRTLWTAAGKGISCKESTTPTLLVTTDIAATLAASETTNDISASLAANETITDIAATLTRLPFSTKTAPYSSLHLAKETTVMGGDEPTATQEKETGYWDGMFSWISNTLCVAIFLAFMAVYYCIKTWKIHCPRDAIQGKDNRPADYLPLHRQPTADITKQYAGYINKNNEEISL
jgi:hypothetical protein